MLNLLKPRNKTSRETIIPVVILVLVVLYVYFPLTKTFYQQDEWLGLGSYLVNGVRYIFLNASGILPLILAQGRILSNILFSLFVGFFPFNITPFAIFAIVFHSLNVVLVFLLSKKMFKRVLPAFLGSLFFAVSSVSQSAVTWPATIIGTLPSTTLIILSIFTFIKFFEKKSGKWLVLTFLLLYISLFFKESAIFLFLYLPLASLLFERFNIKKFLSAYWPFIGFFLVDAIFRIFELRATDLQQTLFLEGSSSSYWQTLLTRAVLYPLTSFSLTFVPPEPFLWFARSLTKIYYPFVSPQEFILFAQTAVLDILSICLTFLILTFTSVFLRFSGQPESKYIKFFIGFLLFSFLPYILISKNYAYLESRYYYLSSFAGGAILSWMAIKTAEIIGKTKVYFLKPAVVVIFVLFLFYHLKYLESGISKEVLIGQERKSFLIQLFEQVPEFNENKNIIYITSDQDFYIVGNKVPFQQGMGYTLMSLYYRSGKIPQDFLKEGYLFEIGSQGYKEKGSYGFGYFTDKKQIDETIKKYKLSRESVISLYYHVPERKLKKVE